MFSRLHPNFALWIGKTWSKRSRYAKGIVAKEFVGEEGELQIVFAKQELKHTHFDFFVFGHRHIPWDIRIGEKSRLINLGDWIYSNTFGELDGQTFSLKQYNGDGKNILRKSYELD
jgi:UDP-2,3-diacylglucosamine hydrolase